jgi:hypothetical protein
VEVVGNLEVQADHVDGQPRVFPCDCVVRVVIDGTVGEYPSGSSGGRGAVCAP